MVWIIPVILIAIVIAVVLSEPEKKKKESLFERFFEPEKRY
jgi:cytochrome c-type biogenesis protein CcmH/NrfF